ncbi:MAG: peptide deformylase [candidate division WOR-3 bacterium]
MVRKIRIFPDPVLRKVCEPLDINNVGEELFKMVEDLVDTMFAYDGLGLSAPQIGITKRVFVVNKGEFTGNEGEFQVIINPEIVYYEGEEVREEGCLSFPDLYYEIKRPYMCILKGYELKDGKIVPVEIAATGLYARVLMHETDHLNGILFIDYIDPKERVKVLREWKREMKLKSST